MGFSNGPELMMHKGRMRHDQREERGVCQTITLDHEGGWGFQKWPKMDRALLEQPLTRQLFNKLISLHNYLLLVNL